MLPADWNASSIAVIACPVHDDSGPPQLIEITEGLFVASWTAVVMAFRNPASVFSAKYTTIFAPGAIAPTTSISSITSASGPLGSPVGVLLPFPTDTAVTRGVLVKFTCFQYASRSAGLNPPPNSMIATHSPVPSAFAG